jgi:SpoVK/Ycf46/Vps4 family AAA+-type ATPase
VPPLNASDRAKLILESLIDFGLPLQHRLTGRSERNEINKLIQTVTTYTEGNTPRDIKNLTRRIACRAAARYKSDNNSCPPNDKRKLTSEADALEILRLDDCKFSMKSSSSGDCEITVDLWESIVGLVEVKIKILSVLHTPVLFRRLFQSRSNKQRSSSSAYLKLSKGIMLFGVNVD